MWINGFNYRLTKHGRRRFIKRVGYMSDSDILRTVGSGEVIEIIPRENSFIMVRSGKALGFINTGFNFIFRPDWRTRGALRLVTVYMGDAMVCLEPILDIVDRPSEFTFNFSDFKRRINNGKA